MKLLTQTFCKVYFLLGVFFYNVCFFVFFFLPLLSFSSKRDKPINVLML